MNNKTGIAREERKKGDIEIGMEEPLKYRNVPRQIHRESVFTRRKKGERGGQGKRRGKDKEGEVRKKEAQGKRENLIRGGRMIKEEAEGEEEVVERNIPIKQQATRSEERRVGKEG